MSVIKRHKSTIAGLSQDLDSLTSGIAAAQSAVTDEATQRGLAISSAISQEAADRDQAINNAISLEVTNRDQAISSATAGLMPSSAGADFLSKSSLLADLGDSTALSTARSNLGVYATSEVDQRINEAKLALGTNYTVADIAARDALRDLDLADFVTVTNGGNWAKYGVASVDGSGVPTFFVVTTKEQYEASNSASAVKDALLSNPDTNVLTNAELAKLNGIDTSLYLPKADVLDAAGFATAAAGQVGDAVAVKSYIAEAVRTGGQANITETLTVGNAEGLGSGDRIVLTYAPKNGMIFNFATVRCTVDGLTYDIPVIHDVADADSGMDGRVYILQPDAAGEFDGKQVMVQYPAVVPA